jgi:thioredoxin-related protein
MKIRFYFFLNIIIGFQAMAETNLATLNGRNLITEKNMTISSENKKALVVIFLSAKCPCSNSHIKEINDLANLYSNFSFVAVHSNFDEPRELSKPYFQNVGINFPVLEDSNQTLADQFKASKTPHAFVIMTNGDLVYQGGVSNSNDFTKSDRSYLREALSDLTEGKKVKTPEGRTLGCAISRGKNNVW